MSDTEITRERLISNARVMFTSVAILLQLALVSSKGIETELPLINIAIPPLHKWVWGGFALIFLIWSLVIFLTAYSEWVRGKVGKIVEKTFVVSTTFAVIATGIAWVQGFALSAQAGLGNWYVWVMLALGFIFYLLYALYPLYRRYCQKREKSNILTVHPPKIRNTATTSRVFWTGVIAVVVIMGMFFYLPINSLGFWEIITMVATILTLIALVYTWNYLAKQSKQMKEQSGLMTEQFNLMRTQMQAQMYADLIDKDRELV